MSLEAFITVYIIIFLAKVILITWRARACMSTINKHNIVLNNIPVTFVQFVDPNVGTIFHTNIFRIGVDIANINNIDVIIFYYLEVGEIIISKVCFFSLHNDFKNCYKQIHTHLSTFWKITEGVDIESKHPVVTRCFL